MAQIVVDEKVLIKFEADINSLNTQLKKAQDTTKKASANISKSLINVRKAAIVASAAIGAMGVGLGIMLSKGIATRLEMEEFRGTVGGLKDALEEADINGQAFMATMSTPFYEALTVGMKEVNRLIGEAGPKAMDAMGKTMNSIAKGMVQAINVVIKAVAALVNSIRLAYNGYQQLAQLAKSVGSSIGSTLGETASYWGDVLGLESFQKAGQEMEAFYAKTKSASSDALNTLSQEVDGIFNSAVNFNSELDKITTKITTAIDEGKSFSEIFKETKETLIAMGEPAEKAAKAAKAHIENIKEMRVELTRVGELYEDIGTTVGDAMTDMFVSWQDGALNFKETMRNVLNDIAAQIFQMAVSENIAKMLSGGLGSLFGGATQLVPAFASGGIVNSPTMFSDNGTASIMGEAGPEAIMPVSRTSGGDLGVKVDQVPMNVNIQNYGDQQVDVQQSDNSLEVIISKISSDISRGVGTLGASMESRYGLRKV